MLRGIGGQAPEDDGRGTLTVRVDGDDVLPDVVARLRAAGIAVEEFSLHLPSLDEVFFTLTGTRSRRRTTRRHWYEEAFPRCGTRSCSAKRNLIKLTRTPEQLIDVTLQPIIFLVLFLYVFGGAIAHGSRHDYLQFLLPGLIGQTIAMSSISIGQNMNADIAKGVFDRFRSLPIGRSVPLVGAVLADFFRYLVLCVITGGLRLPPRLPHRDQPAAAARGARHRRSASPWRSRGSRCGSA